MGEGAPLGMNLERKKTERPRYIVIVVDVGSIGDVTVLGKSSASCTSMALETITPQLS